MKFKNKSTWLKNRGYLHLTNQIDVNKSRGEILGKVKNPEFVENHSFFPLIHTNIKERRYKRIQKDKPARAHSDNGESFTKLRPLHYATHIDSMIFGYYGEMLQDKYINELSKAPKLIDCVTAYRRIEDPHKEGKYKSTIHFAHEVFSKIEEMSVDGCCVLKFDIEKFFSSMDHIILKKAWADLIEKPTLPPDHYNVFRAATKFSFVLKDDLRVTQTGNGKKKGFDEKKLADIRKKNISAFFESPKFLKNAIANKELKVYKNSFRNKENLMVGIPQGLPISATLANLYLLHFDKKIVEKVVDKLNGFYRRYSDDIIVICKLEDEEKVKIIVAEAIGQSKVEISIPKTEIYHFSKEIIDSKPSQTVGYLIQSEGKIKRDYPLTYLGFEYYGHRTLIKSANLAKFYRRMIFAVKSRARRAKIANQKNSELSTAIFKRRLYHLYTNINLDKKEIPRRFKKLVTNRFGDYVYQSELSKKKFQSNYFSYGERAAEIMNEDAIVKQTKRHRTIFNQAIKIQKSKYDL